MIEGRLSALSRWRVECNATQSTDLALHPEPARHLGKVLIHGGHDIPLVLNPVFEDWNTAMDQTEFPNIADLFKTHALQDTQTLIPLLYFPHPICGVVLTPILLSSLLLYFRFSQREPTSSSSSTQTIAGKISSSNKIHLVESFSMGWCVCLVRCKLSRPLNLYSATSHH